MVENIIIVIKINIRNVELNIIKIIKFRKMLQNTLGEKEQVLKRNAIKREENYKIK